MSGMWMKVRTVDPDTGRTVSERPRVDVDGIRPLAPMVESRWPVCECPRCGRPGGAVIPGRGLV